MVSDFLKIAFETFWHRGLPLRESLPLCALIRGGVPKARKIWGYSVFSRTLNKHIDQVLRFQRDAMRGLLVGEYTMDTPSVRLSLTVQELPSVDTFPIVPVVYCVHLNNAQKV